MVLINKNYDIKNETTFRIGGVVRDVIIPENISEFVDVLTNYKFDYILGNCSNTLISSSKIDKTIILTKKLDKYTFEGNLLTVECGAKGPILSRECQSKNLSGFEFLIGFPGSFGGMIAMNASAHGQAISDTFVSCKLFDLDKKEILIFDKAQMMFDYRKSILSDSNFIVLEATFELKEGSSESIKDIMDRNVAFRKEHQPSLARGNAGSTFKNPVGDSAGRLLDLCEMKGAKVGGAMVFEKHANFVINNDNATSKDVLSLMYKMYSNVREKYTIELCPEIKFISGEEMEEKQLWQEMTKNTH